MCVYLVSVCVSMYGKSTNKLANTHTYILTLHYITLQYIALHAIPLHYITLHTYLHTNFINTQWHNNDGQMYGKLKTTSSSPQSASSMSNQFPPDHIELQPIYSRA